MTIREVAATQVTHVESRVWRVTFDMVEDETKITIHKRNQLLNKDGAPVGQAIDQPPVVITTAEFGQDAISVGGKKLAVRDLMMFLNAFMNSEAEAMIRTREREAQARAEELQKAEDETREREAAIRAKEAEEAAALERERVESEARKAAVRAAEAEAKKQAEAEPVKQ